MNQHVTLLGLPGAGKSTFLAALWYLCTTNEVPTAFSADGRPADRRYLNSLRDAWLRFRAPERNKVDTEELIDLPLKDAAGHSFALSIPDLAGETFRSHWRDGVWPVSYQRQCEKTSGLVFFIKPDGILEPCFLRDANSTLAQQGEEGAPAEPHPAVVSPPWDADKSPTQVQLVSLLQLVAKAARQPLRVALIVSAWDLVQSTEPKTKDPEAWLRKRLPLLDQFLRANDLGLSHRVYGVSAQGGDLLDKEAVAKMQELDRPSERIRVIGPDAGPHDLTAPLRWLLE